MEIERSVYQRVTSLLEQAHGKSEAEFEVRFWNPGFERIEISEDRFRRIFEYYTFKRENDGLECAYTTTSSLDVCVTSTGNTYSTILDRTRLTVEGTQQIKKYWMQGNLEGIEYKMMEKRKLEKMDLPEYFIRITMNEEMPEANIFPKNRAILLNQANNVGGPGANATKHFRLKNRYKITTPDGLFSIDLTTLKSGSGRNFKEANILKMAPTYEVEIEYIGGGSRREMDDWNAVASSLFDHVNTVLSIMNDTDFVVKQSIKSDVLRSYQALIQVRPDQPSYSNEMRPEFICANPVTIHRSNLLKSTNVQNICNRYAVSIKADGMRMLAYVLPSTKPEMNGRIYLININDEIIDTGLRDTTYVNSVVEGEYVELSDKSGHEFYAYDMMFDRGNDIRRRQYYNTYTEPAMRCRSVHLDGFLRSTTRVPSAGEGAGEGASPVPVIPMKRKEYTVSTQADGMDIFAKSLEIWNKRSYQTFYVDGLIYTPMYEHYPLKGGSWYSLFKWKPENLNTIDFLIRVTKSEEGVELRYPYMDSILRPDGGMENVLRQYKKIKLYVGTFRDAFNEKAHKMTKRKYETLFNPYDLSEDEALAYHIAHVFVDEDGKMMAKDPISGEESTIYDETIVEFGFDGTREKGFQWVPYRMRHDKTASYKGGRHVFGNLDKTANDIFRSLHYPVTEEMVTTGRVPIEATTGMAVGAPASGQGSPYYAAMKEGNNDSMRFPYQNFHNHYIKYKLFAQVSPALLEGIKTMKGKILDLCSGKGVDVTKMKRALYAEVVGIDVDYDNVKFAQQYYDRVIPKPKPKAYFVRGDSGKLVFPNFDIASTESDKMQLQKYIPIRNYFDVVSVQFALHYFFENEISIRTLLQNANDNLKIGGYFIGTCFDGARIYEMLKGVDQVEGKTFSDETLWKIQRKYKVTRMAFDASKPNFGKQIDVYVKSIGNVHSEYLVNFAYLDRLLGEYGFQRIAVKPFYDHYDDLLKSEYEEEGAGNSGEKAKNLDNAKRMSEEEQRFSFLNNSFVYQKVENTSDALFKKLVKMIADKAKKTVTKEVEVMNEETAHLEEAVAAAQEGGFATTGDEE